MAEGKYKSARKLTQAIVVLLITSVALAVGFFLALADFFVLGFVELIATDVALVLTLIWVYHTHANLPHLNAGELRYSPGWSVGWYFIPFANLVMPYRVMAETWRASSYHSGPDDSVAWKQSPVSPLVGWWWTLYLAANLVVAVGVIVVSSNPSVDSAFTAAITLMIVLPLLSTITTILLLRRLSNLQDIRYRQLSGHDYNATPKEVTLGSADVYTPEDG